jgi:type II secretory pathway component PulJ
MTPGARQRRWRRGAAGLTLIELLVSITLGMILIALAWSAFVKCKDAAARTSLRVDLHTSASAYRELMQRDFANFSPATALFARSTPGVIVGTDKVDTVEIVFMRSIHPLRTQYNESIAQQFMADYHWIRWRFKRTWRQVAGVWKVYDHTLYRSQSTPNRRWNAVQTIAGSSYDDPTGGIKPNGADSGGLLYINIPRPLRDASAGIPALDFNTYNTPAASIVAGSGTGDIGDLTDLDRNELAASSRVRDFMVGWVDAGGNLVTVASDTAADQRIDGLYMDVLGPSGNAYATQLAKRPRVMRITMNLAEANVSQDFSFSIATPGLPPQFRP